MSTATLSPFEISKYFRDHAPADARQGMRGYLLRMLLDLARLRGKERGSCFPSLAYLAEKAGRSVRHVRRLLAELEGLGEIKRVYRKRADGGWSSSIYEMRGLLSWAAKNVRRVPDTHGRKPEDTKLSNPAQGGKSSFGKKRAAASRSIASNAPVEGAGYAVKMKRAETIQQPSVAITAPPAQSAPKWKALTPEQVEEARNGCNPVRWDRLRLEAGLDGVAHEDLSAAAAHRWRADAIMTGIKLMT